MIVVVDYGMGNSGSILNMLRRLGIASQLSGVPADIERAERLILPGVGAFDQGVDNIVNRGLREPLNRAVLERKAPLLGICLGMQLITDGSNEGRLPGLGWIKGRAHRFEPVVDDKGRRDKVPHMGWNYTTSGDHPLFSGADADTRFYFVHSYHVACEDPSDVIAGSWYGGAPFAAAIGHDNIVGVQFHPEKSHRYGMKLLRNFIQWRPGGIGAHSS